MSGWHAGQGKPNQEEQYASIRVIITSVTTLGLELHGAQLRIIHFRDEKESIYLSAPCPAAVMAYPIGNPFQPYFQMVHTQVVNRFSYELWAKSKKQVEELR